MTVSMWTLSCPRAIEVSSIAEAKIYRARIIGNPNFCKSYAVNLNHAHEELQDLVERVTVELELMNVAKELER